MFAKCKNKQIALVFESSRFRVSFFHLNIAATAPRSSNWIWWNNVSHQLRLYCKKDLIFITSCECSIPVFKSCISYSLRRAYSKKEHINFVLKYMPGVQLYFREKKLRTFRPENTGDSRIRHLRLFAKNARRQVTFTYFYLSKYLNLT